MRHDFWTNLDTDNQWVHREREDTIQRIRMTMKREMIYIYVNPSSISISTAKE